MVGFSAVTASVVPQQEGRVFRLFLLISLLRSSGETELTQGSFPRDRNRPLLVHVRGFYKQDGTGEKVRLPEITRVPRRSASVYVIVPVDEAATEIRETSHVRASKSL